VGMPDAEPGDAQIDTSGSVPVYTLH